MDAPALCDSILEFVGSGLPAQDGFSKPAPPTDHGGAGEGGKVDAGNDAGPTSFPAAGQAEQHIQKQGLMRAFMGNKVRCIRRGRVFGLQKSV